MGDKRNNQNLFITITQVDDYIGTEQIKIGQKLYLEKDLDNRYDDESIMVKTENGAKCGLVANSVTSVARGSHSAGYIYSTFEKESACVVCFVLYDKLIARLVDED